MPRTVSLSRLAGVSALKSASFAQAPSFILYAGASNIIDDLERLVLASWVSSGNVLRDTTTYTANDMVNFAKGGRDWFEHPVVRSVIQRDSTLSVLTLISIPTILLPLLVLVVRLSCVLRCTCLRRPSTLCGYVVRGTSLWSTHLYRYFGKELYGRVRRRSHRLAHIPAMYKPYGHEESKLLLDEEAQCLPGLARSQGNQQYPLRTDTTETVGKSPEAKEAGVPCPYDCAEPRPVVRTTESQAAYSQAAELEIKA
ncbi:hypothetical protein HOY82DRAFT_632873 [Tuber indicum]|nr:hypothetical protein HOY82DRAFT_632873 [Tuber indicum]